MRQNIFNAGIAFLFSCFVFSCNESSFLEEKPLDFLSPENAYNTYADYETALTGLYAKVRANFYNSDFVFFQETDVAKNARDNNNFMGNLKDWLTPQQAGVADVWDREYKLINNANTIISRIESSSLNAEQKSQVAAEAKFFRAFGYRTLVYIFGGVPLVLEENVSPKTDFTRNSKEEVLKAMYDDFLEATTVLPDIHTVVDGKISNLVAKHYLAETCISLGLYDDAIRLASEVIDNPNTGLMKVRFGSHKSEEGDVYWDLFRRKNQNRKTSGNTEALWVIQMEPDVEGGYLTSTSYRPYYLERFAAPVTYSCTDPEGKKAFLSSNGRSDANVGGRGVSNMSNTHWWLYEVWGDDFSNDMRNSKYNVVRDAYYDLPTSKYYGKSIIAPETKSKLLEEQSWRWYPWPTKITTPGEHPEALYADPALKTLKSTAGATYLDQYMLRLAETYLLRAEAFLMKGDKEKAANDINEVRNRAHTSEVVASEVTIDYILDERARELVYEEFRRITLGRLGKYVERVRKYNTLNGPRVEDYHELFPIPYSAIEANKDAVLEQNPGYKN